MSRDLVREFLTALRVERGLSANTIEAYRRDLEQAAAWARRERGKDLPSLSREDVRDFLREKKERGYDVKSIARSMTTLRNFFKFLILDGVLKTDPTVGLDTPRSWRRSRS